MEAQLEKIREVQKEAWSKSSQGWKKWDEMVMNFMKPASDEMIRMLKIKSSDIVLDVATGTGEPGLTIAGMLKEGKVTGIDLSGEMLAVAREKASGRGTRNFETACCDVSELPFEDNSFDVICCRFGFMFFPDMQLALKEMIRVLKPGGRIATSVWNVPEKNFWINASMETMISMLQLNPPRPGATGAFRCSQKGFMAELLKQAGFTNIASKEVDGKLNCGTLETYWSFITEVGSPLAYSKADRDLQNRIKEVVLAKVKQKSPDGNIALDSNAIVVYGEK